MIRIEEKQRIRHVGTQLTLVNVFFCSRSLSSGSIRSIRAGLCRTVLMSKQAGDIENTPAGLQELDQVAYLEHSPWRSDIRQSNAVDFLWQKCLLVRL